MGSFKGHVLPGTLFLVVGAWHVWCSVVRYVSDPGSFRGRVWILWNPVPGLGGRLEYLELYVVTGGAFVDMCVELLYSTHLRWFVGGVLNPAHMNDFEHGGMLLMFFLFGVVALLSDTTRWNEIKSGAYSLGGSEVRGDIGGNSFAFYLLLFFRYLPLPEGPTCLIAATAFSAEYLLFYFHSTTHKGLEGYYHLLLVILIALCIASTVAGALVPTSFAIDLCSSISITLQGLWFYQTAFTLYGPMMPEGCRLEDSSITCRSHSSEVRGELLANFQFFGLVLIVFLAVVGSYSIAASRYGHPELGRLHAAEVDGVNVRNTVLDTGGLPVSVYW